MLIDIVEELKKEKGSIIVKANGEVWIKSKDKEHFLQHDEHNSMIFAQGVQLVLSYFIGYQPIIIEEKGGMPKNEIRRKIEEESEESATPLYTL